MIASLPHSEESERAVLSCVLLDGASALAKAIDSRIVAECFTGVIRPRIWKAVIWLQETGKPIDLTVLVEEFKRLDKLGELGGMDGVIAETKSQPTTLQFSYHLQALRDYYIARQVVTIADEAREMAMRGRPSVDDFISSVTGALAIKNQADTSKTLQQAAGDVVGLCERIMDGTETQEDAGLSFPWRDWNSYLGPAQGGELVILSARPGMGKSSAARQMAYYWSVNVGHVLYFSREMPVGTLPQLFAQTECGVSWRQFKKRQLERSQMADFVKAVKRVQANTRLHIFDKDDSLSQVIARVQAFCQLWPIKAIFIDYLQIFCPGQKDGETRDIAIGRMTKAFKGMANDLNIPVVVLAQVGRGSERENRRPRLSDLRESGNIEQDADRVIFLDAPDINKRTGVQQNLNDGSLTDVYVNAIQAKGRGEGQHTAEMMFHRPTTTFRDLAP